MTAAARIRAEQLTFAFLQENFNFVFTIITTLEQIMKFLCESKISTPLFQVVKIKTHMKSIL